MGGSGVDPWSTYYKSPLLTEQLLLAHNRGMEKEMIDSYKEGRKGDLKFLKNRMKTAKAAHQAMKKTHHNSWKAVHEKVKIFSKFKLQKEKLIFLLSFEVYVYDFLMIRLLERKKIC
jgi:hypothetical protein